MNYTIWRVSPDGGEFQLTSAGISSVKEKAVEKARVLNDKLRESEPDSQDRYVVRDAKGREIRFSVASTE